MLLIAAAILAARKLAQWDGGKPTIRCRLYCCRRALPGVGRVRPVESFSKVSVGHPQSAFTSKRNSYSVHAASVEFGRITPRELSFLTTLDKLGSVRSAP